MKAFVVIEDEPTSSKSHDTIKDEVLKTIREMAPWGDMHEELKIEEVTPMSKVEERIFQLNKEMEATIVKQKEENLKNMIVSDYVPKFLLEHNYQFFGIDEGGNHHSFHSSMTQVGIEKNEVASWEATQD